MEFSIPKCVKPSWCFCLPAIRGWMLTSRCTNTGTASVDFHSCGVQDCSAARSSYQPSMVLTKSRSPWSLDIVFPLAFEYRNTAANLHKSDENHSVNHPCALEKSCQKTTKMSNSFWMKPTRLWRFTFQLTFCLFMWDPPGMGNPNHSFTLFGWWAPGMASWRICYWPRHSWKCASWCGGPVSPLPNASRCGCLLCMGFCCIFAAFWLDDLIFLAQVFVLAHRKSTQRLYIVCFWSTWKASALHEDPQLCPQSGCCWLNFFHSSSTSQ